MKLFILYTCILNIMIGWSSLGQLRSGENIVVDERVEGDLYVAGGTITVNAPINGDLVAAGGTITINDSIKGDLLVAGGQVVVNGAVADDIRAAGGRITITSNVGEDVLQSGGRLHIARSAVIGGNLYCGGGEVVLDGTVQGEIRNTSGKFAFNGKAYNGLETKSGTLEINGIIDGPIVFSAPRIELGDSARLNGNVRYWCKDESIDFKGHARGFTTTYDPSLEIESGKWYYLGFATFILLLWYLGMAFLLIALIQYFFSKTFRRSAENIFNTSLRAFGSGVGLFIAIPLAIIISAITVIGVPVSILLIIAALLLFTLTTIMVSVTVSNWLNNVVYRHQWGNGYLILAAFVIFILLKLVSLTPFVGPGIVFLLAALTFGGLVLNFPFRKMKTATSTAS